MHKSTNTVAYIERWWNLDPVSSLLLRRVPVSALFWRASRTNGRFGRQFTASEASTDAVGFAHHVIREFDAELMQSSNWVADSSPTRCNLYCYLAFVHDSFEESRVTHHLADNIHGRSRYYFLGIATHGGRAEEDAERPARWPIA